MNPVNLTKQELIYLLHSIEQLYIHLIDIEGTNFLASEHEKALDELRTKLLRVHFQDNAVAIKRLEELEKTLKG